MTAPPVAAGSVATAVLTGTALVGFAANSLLCRMALAPGLGDAVSFTSVRLLSGALMLAVIVRWKGAPPAARRSGSWAAALALFAYAAAFSFAYLRLGVGIGALMLFGAVQVTMIAAGLRSGERPGRLEWVGLAVATAGLAALTLPGSSAPDPGGAALMALAGVAWGGYSLIGRRSAHPLAGTADNFARTLPLALLASALTLGSAHLTSEGLLLAVASGAIASGLVYAVWYAALRGLTASRAAIVQLGVPVLAALGGVLVLDETVTLRLVLSGAMIFAGIVLAVSRPGSSP